MNVDVASLREGRLRSLVSAVIAGRFALARSPLTATLTILTVAAASSLVVGLEIASRSVREELGKTSRALLGNAEIEVVASKRGIPEELVAAVAAVPGVLEASPVITETLRIEGTAAEGLGLNVLGVDLLAQRQTRDFAVTRDAVRVRDPLRLLARPNSVIIAASLAGRIGAREGSTLRVRSPVGHHELVVEGLIEPGGLGDAFGGQIAVMDVYALQALLDARGFVDKIEVDAAEGVDPDTLVPPIQAALEGRASVRPVTEQEPWYGGILRLIGDGVRLVSLIGVVVAALLVYGAINHAVERRVREFALMRCAGIAPRGIATLVAVDVFVLGGIGIALGVTLGAAGAPVLLSGLSSVSQYIARVEIRDAGISLSAVATGVAASAAIAFLACLRPARRASSVPPLALLIDPSNPEVPDARRNRLTIVGSISVVAVGLAQLLRGSVPAAILLACVSSIGVAAVLIATPRLLVSIGGTMRRRFRSWPRVVWIAGTLAPTRSSDTGLQTAVLATVVCSAIAIAIVRESLVTNMDEEVGRRYQDAVAIFPGDFNSGVLQGTILPRTIEIIRSTDGVEQVVEYRNVHVTMGSKDVTIFAFQAGTLFQRGNITVEGSTLDELRAALERGDVAVTHAFRRSEGVSTGDKMVLETPTGRHEFEVAGLIRMFDPPGGLIIMDLGALEKHFRREGADFVGLWTSQEFDPLLDEVRRRTSAEQSLFFVDGVTLGRHARDRADRFAGLVTALAALALAFAGLGMLSLIAARIATSRNELGLLYALGATPNEIRLLVASEASCFAAIGVAAGAALGVVVGPIASDLLGESVGWVIEPHLPWGVVGSVAIAAFGSAVFASILPALAIRTGPSLPPTIS